MLGSQVHILRINVDSMLRVASATPITRNNVGNQWKIKRSILSAMAYSNNVMTTGWSWLASCTRSCQRYNYLFKATHHKKTSSKDSNCLVTGENHTYSNGKNSGSPLKASRYTKRLLAFASCWYLKITSTSTCWGLRGKCLLDRYTFCIDLCLSASRICCVLHDM